MAGLLHRFARLMVPIGSRIQKRQQTAILVLLLLELSMLSCLGPESKQFQEGVLEDEVLRRTSTKAANDSGWAVDSHRWRQWYMEDYIRSRLVDPQAPEWYREVFADENVIKDNTADQQSGLEEDISLQFPVAVFSLPHRKDRRLHTTHLLNTLGFLNLSFPETIRSQDVDPQEYINRGQLHPESSAEMEESMGTDSVRPYVAHSFSILRYLQSMMNTTSTFLGVFEDDLMAYKSLPETRRLIVQALSQLPETADILFLEGCWESCELLGYSGFRPNLARSSAPFCTGAMVFTRKGAQKTQQLLVPMFETFDGMIAKLVRSRDLEVYQSVPIPLTQDLYWRSDVKRTGNQYVSGRVAPFCGEIPPRQIGEVSMKPWSQLLFMCGNWRRILQVAVLTSLKHLPPWAMKKAETIRKIGLNNGVDLNLSSSKIVVIHQSNQLRSCAWIDGDGTIRYWAKPSAKAQYWDTFVGEWSKESMSRDERARAVLVFPEDSDCHFQLSRGSGLSTENKAGKGRAQHHYCSIESEYLTSDGMPVVDDPHLYGRYCTTLQWLLHIVVTPDDHIWENPRRQPLRKKELERPAERLPVINSASQAQNTSDTKFASSTASSVLAFTSNLGDDSESEVSSVSFQIVSPKYRSKLICPTGFPAVLEMRVLVPEHIQGPVFVFLNGMQIDTIFVFSESFNGTQHLLYARTCELDQDLAADKYLLELEHDDVVVVSTSFYAEYLNVGDVPADRCTEWAISLDNGVDSDWFMLSISDGGQFASEEESVHLQGGEEGVVMGFVLELGLSGRRYVEFGGGDATLSPMRVLREFYGFTGVSFDPCCESNSLHLHKQRVLPQEINKVLSEHLNSSDFDVLSFDREPRSYSLWKKLDDGFQPALVVIPYDAWVDAGVYCVREHRDDEEFRFHPRSPLQQPDASLLAVQVLGIQKGYRLVYVDQHGTKAFFVRSDLLHKLRPHNSEWTTKKHLNSIRFRPLTPFSIAADCPHKPVASLESSDLDYTNLLDWERLQFCRRFGYRSRLEGTPKLFDAFMFNGEMEILEVRLAELDPVVDKFILLEASTTFSGKPKPLYFQQNKWRFSAFLDRIEYVPIDLPKDSSINCSLEINMDCKNWVRENMNRNEMVKAFDRLGAGASDVVLVADVDEIIPRETAWVIKHCQLPLPLTINSELFFYKWKWRFSFPNGKPFSWPHPQVATVNQTRKMKASRIRHGGPLLHQFKYIAGWHLSFFRDASGIAEVLSAYVHQQEQFEGMADKAWLERCIEEGLDFTNDTTRFQGSKLTAQPAHARRRPIAVQDQKFSLFQHDPVCQSYACDDESTTAGGEAKLLEESPGSVKPMTFHPSLPLVIPSELEQ